MPSFPIRVLCTIAIAGLLFCALYLGSGSDQVATTNFAPAVSPSVGPIQPDGGGLKGSDESLVKGWTNDELSAYMGGKVKHLMGGQKQRH